MNFQIAIVKEDGVSTATLQDRQNGLSEDFGLENVLGDFIKIRSETAKNNKHYIQYNLIDHVFAGTFGLSIGQDEENWLETRYDDIKVSFRFLKSSKALLNDSDQTFLKKQSAFQELVNKFRCAMALEILVRDEMEASVVSYNTVPSDYSELKNQDTWFDYKCNCVLDMVVAVMHYCLMNGYKLIKCHHCGLYFATQTLKRKYCRRISPFQNACSQKSSTSEECEITVRRELQYLKARKDRILRRIGQSPKGQTVLKSYYLKIADQCAERMKDVRNYPSTQKLTEFNTYLSEIEQQGKWK